MFEEPTQRLSLCFRTFLLISPSWVSCLVWLLDWHLLWYFSTVSFIPFWVLNRWHKQANCRQWWNGRTTITSWSTLITTPPHLTKTKRHPRQSIRIRKTKNPGPSPRKISPSNLYALANVTMDNTGTREKRMERSYKIVDRLSSTTLQGNQHQHISWKGNSKAKVWVMWLN